LTPLFWRRSEDTTSSRWSPETRSRPPEVPAQTVPAGASARQRTDRLRALSGIRRAWNPAAVRRTTPPPSVPTQRVPSLETRSDWTLFTEKAGSVAAEWTSNSTPSKRASPSWVASQTKPSGVCATAWTLFCGRPWSEVQDRRRYWVRAR